MNEITDISPKPTVSESTIAHEKKFSAFYDAEIRPGLADIETERIAALKEFNVRKNLAFLGVACVLVLALVFYALLTTEERAGLSPSHLFFLVLAAAFVTGFWAMQPVKQYEDKMKARLLPQLMNYFGEFTFVPEGGITPDIIKKTALIYTAAANIMVTDTVIGRAGNQRLSFSHVLVQTGSGKSTEIHFQGMLILAEMTKRRFAHRTVARSLREELHLGDNNADMQVVDLESPDFERQFDVRSEDQVEARYLLTPDVMEALYDFTKHPGLGELQCSFIDDTLCISINDMAPIFESVSVFKSVLDAESFRTFIERVQLTLALIDALEG